MCFFLHYQGGGAVFCELFVNLVYTLTLSSTCPNNSEICDSRFFYLNGNLFFKVERNS